MRLIIDPNLRHSLTEQILLEKYGFVPINKTLLHCV